MTVSPTTKTEEDQIQCHATQRRLETWKLTMEVLKTA
jgi:hypothetical protein